MKKLSFILFVLLCCQKVVVAQTESITTFILVRHAEKADDGTADPALTPEGIARSKRLAALFSDTEIDAVYSTKYKRTMNTVLPVASERALDIQTYEPGKAGFADMLLVKHNGLTVLIAGHSNTVPQLANALIGRDEYENFPDDAYGNILIVSVVRKGEATKVLALHY